MIRYLILTLGLSLVLMPSSIVFAEEACVWKQTAALAAPEAVQAAAADDAYVYAINNTTVAKYDRASGKLIARSEGDAHHLNSGFLHAGKLYCAHSNYPLKPESSIIKVLDLKSMQLSDFHDFGHSPHGSLTVAVFKEDAWWCVFAVYGKEDNARTVLVKFDPQWEEQGVWKFPASVVSDLGSSSISGGIWQGDEFLATGHDKKVLYRLKLPEAGSVLLHLATCETPFPGQGIAIDPPTGGLVGIHRKNRQVLFAEPAKIDRAP
ncbi:endonuclease [Blastopirellula marina]|uniref:Endonuclease n=1 Tax=Blastopirellula marina TaxID=124 RepID=A0A2S8F997_9BACT|nr:endonuclease [Blastopirellula marina]PQO28736.1 endonuclease [Blastopirellula marina]PTL42009.1 endonuclease [Blastopirellula marina]